MNRLLHVAAQRSQDDGAARLLPFAGRTFPRAGRIDIAAESRTEDLSAHLERFGSRPSAAGDAALALLGTLDEAGLSGHGGGHFPVARKWRSALGSRPAGGLGGTRGILVANAAESEPESAKDRTLLLAAPHLVLDGIACAVETLGTAEAVVWLHESEREVAFALEAALAERQARGLPDPSIRLVAAPAAYLSGESSAVLSGLSGGPALPTFSRRPAAVDGFRGRPAVVHNVETLARIGLLARTGVRSYRPTALVTVSTPGARTVLELATTASIDEAVHLGGWSDAPPQAVLLGGYGGAWLPWSVASHLRLREADLRAAGASLGAGVIIPIAPYECGIVRSAEIAGFLAAAGARQCGPCRFGLPAMAQRLAALARGRAHPEEATRLLGLAALVNGRGACHHPDGAARMVASALATFEADAARHAKGLPCAASSATLAGVS